MARTDRTERVWRSAPEPAGATVAFPSPPRKSEIRNRKSAIPRALTGAGAGGPLPRIALIERTNANEVAIRFNTRSNWTHVLQYRDVLSADSGSPWRDLFTPPPQPFDGEVEVRDAVTDRQRFYRLNVSPQ